MSHAPQAPSPEVLASVPDIQPVRGSVVTDTVLRVSMVADRMQRGLQGLAAKAPTKLVERYVAARDVSPETEASLLKGAAFVGVAAVAYTQRRVLGEVIGNGFDGVVDMVTDLPDKAADIVSDALDAVDNFVFEDASAQTSDSTTTSSTPSATEAPTTSTTMDTTSTSEAPGSTTSTTVDPGDTSPATPDGDGGLVTDDDIAPTLAPADAEEYPMTATREDAIRDFTELANNVDFDGYPGGGGRAEPITVDEFVAHHSTQEIRAVNDFASEVDHASPHQRAELDALMEEIHSRDDAPATADADAAPAPADEPMSDDELEAARTEYRQRLEDRFVALATDTDGGTRDAFYDPAEHDGMTPQEFAEQEDLTNGELRDINNFAAQVDHLPADKQADLDAAFESLTPEDSDGTHAGEVESTAAVDTDGDGYPDDIDPSNEVQAAQYYGNLADEPVLPVTVNPGQSVRDAIYFRVGDAHDIYGPNSNSPEAIAQAEAIAKNIRRLFRLQYPGQSLADINELDTMYEVNIAIPQAG